jgi:anti-sigma B factor antagonist
VREQVEQVIATGAAWLLVDLTEVEYIDSVGLGIMIGAAKRTNDRGGDLAIVAVHPQVLRVFQVSGTKELLNVVGSVAEAQALLAAARARGSEQAARGGEG